MLPIPISSPTFPGKATIHAHKDHPASDEEIATLLSSTDTDSARVADICADMYKENNQDRLNSIIHTVTKRGGSVAIRQEVKDILFAQHIVLDQNPDCTIYMEPRTETLQYRAREIAIDDALSPFFPPMITKLISAYDEAMIITPKNQALIKKMIASGQASIESLREIAKAQGDLYVISDTGDITTRPDKEFQGLFEDMWRK
jgi:hypothetical protein